MRKESETLTLYLYYFQLLGLAWASLGMLGLAILTEKIALFF